MPRFILIISLLFIGSFIAKDSHAQNKIGVDTTFVLGQDGNIYEQRKMLVDHAGNKYIMGLFRGSITIGGVTLSSNILPYISQNKALFIVKYDSSNNFNWLKKIAECDTFNIYKTCLDNTGNLYVGMTHRANLEMLNDTIVQKGLTDITLLKLDTSGNKVYHRNIATSCFESISGICTDTNDNLYIAGQYGVDINGDLSNCLIDFGSGIYQDTTKKWFVAKYNSVGNHLWTKSYLSQYGGVIRKIVFSNNRIYMMGQCSSDINNDLNGLILNYTQNYMNNGFLAQLDTAGHAQWARGFGNTSTSLLGAMNPMVFTARGNRVALYVFHHANGSGTTINFEGGGSALGQGMNSYAIANYDTLGNFKWMTSSNALDYGCIKSFAFDSVSNLYGVGSVGRIYFPNNDTVQGYSSNDVLVCSYDSNGNYRYAFNAGGTGIDIADDVAITSIGEVYIMGATTSGSCYMGNDTLLPPLGQSTVFYARIDSIPILSIDSSVSVRDYMLSDNAWSVYPNPANNKVLVRLPHTLLNKAATIAVLNMYGQVLLEQSIKSTPYSLQALALDNLSTGVYFIRLKGEQHLGIKKIIKQ